MSDIQELLKYECPCYKCLTLAICQNKEIQVLLKECKLLYKYLYQGCSGNKLTLNVINLYTFCTIMDIKIKKTGNEYVIKYKWKE